VRDAAKFLTDSLAKRLLTEDHYIEAMQMLSLAVALPDGDLIREATEVVEKFLRRDGLLVE
jgi:hypothetical protein